MKTFKFLFNITFYLLVIFCVFSCSNDVENVEDQVQDELEDYEPYISAQMQEILTMIDTCTTPIPIQTLIPGINSIMGVVTEEETSLSPKLSLRSSTGTTVVTGSSFESVLYTNVSTYVDETWITNMNFPLEAGTYNATCYSATYRLRTYGTGVYEAYEATDIIGMNPDEMTQRGYAIETKVENQLYYFTTYIFEISKPYVTSGLYPLIPTDGGFIRFSLFEDFAYNMQWRYFEI